MEAVSPLKGFRGEFATGGHPVWDEIKPTSEKSGFRRREFKNPDAMDPNWLRLLYRIRQDAGVPMRPISDARPIDGDVGALRSAHKKRPCRATDFQVFSSHERASIIIAAIRNGVVRIGVYPGKKTSEGTDAGGLHLDASDEIDNPSPRIWTGF